MTESQGWVKLHRSILEWEWYKDINTRLLFFHLLIKANHRDNKFQGNEIKRGQLLTGLNSLSAETSLSVQQLRTSLKKLKSTHEVTIESSTKNSLITVVNYDLYQSQDGGQQTEQQTSNKRATNEQQTSNNKQECKERKKERIKEPIQLDSAEIKISSTPSKNSNSIEDRALIFQEELRPFLENTDRETLNAFFLYWTEKNKSGTKMRFELEKTWSTTRRLTTWKNNDYGKNNQRGNASRTEPPKNITTYGKL